MNFFTQLLKDGFEEIGKNPALVVEAVDETIEDVESLIEQSKPVIDTLLQLVEMVGQIQAGTASRELGDSGIQATAEYLATRIVFPPEVEE